ncbi:MAG: hypothetical protein HY023_16325 [Chloroflexi bacterium]|nr:hypothetical protein [Chloroflexota bacterium]
MPSFPEIISRFSLVAGREAAIGMIITAGLLLIARDWRLAVGAVTAQYVLAVVLFAQVIPPQVAGVKLLIGLMSCLILFLSATQADARRREIGGEAASLLQMRGTTLPTGLPFRAIAAVIVGLSALAVGGRPESALPEVSADVTLAVFGLSGMSVLVLALTEAPLEIGLGLLTLLTGFELFYHAVEPSLAAIALLAMAHFGIAVVTGYLAILSAGR